MKIVPIAKDIKQFVKQNIDNNKKTIVKPIKNYSDYLREYGLK